MAASYVSMQPHAIRTITLETAAALQHLSLLLAMTARELSVQLPGIPSSLKSLLLPCSLGAGDCRVPSLHDQVRACLHCVD